VRNRPNSQQEAFRVLEDLASLYRHHRSLGLSPAEYRQIQQIWLTEITPDSGVIRFHRALGARTLR
jgi:hypothetical protein